MTRDEAIEAGRLATALETADYALDRVGSQHDEWVGIVASHEVNADGASHLSDYVMVPKWMATSIFQTLRGALAQRLAALGVDTAEPETPHG